MFASLTLRISSQTIRLTSTQNPCNQQLVAVLHGKPELLCFAGTTLPELVL
jgi:hypothetical protein